MDNSPLVLPPGEDPDKLTSVEAAALLISGGKTKDPGMASYIAEGREFDEDKLIQSHLRRMMGFDFRIKVNPNKIHISSKQEPYVTTHMKLKEGDLNPLLELTNEEAVDRLVDACLRLKNKYEDAKAKV